MVSWQEFPCFSMFLKRGSGKDILVPVMVLWDVNCWAFARQGAQGGALGDTAGDDDPQAFPCLDCEGMKAWRFLCLQSLLRGTSWSCYFVIAPRWNNFKDWDIWDSVMGNLRWSLSHCECGMCSCEGALAPAQVMGVWLPLAPGWSDREVPLALKLRPLKCALGGSHICEWLKC